MTPGRFSRLARSGSGSHDTMNRMPTRRICLVAIVAAVLATPVDRAGALAGLVAAQQSDAGSPRAAAPLTILQINDVYQTGPAVDAGGAGGLARVATLKKTLADAGRHPLLMLAGDFLSSSVESSVFKGEQMIAALNAAGLDMATLGNHEFDFGIDVLLQRMAQAKWEWVISNVIDRTTGRPIGNAAPYVIRTFGALKVGIIGLCLTGDEAVSRDKLERIRLIDPQDAAAMYIPALEKERVDVIVALTHLSFDEDRALAQRFPEIDVIVGGHEHFPIAATVNRTFISKAGSDAKFVARIDVLKRGADLVERFYELIPITAALKDDPATAAVVSDYNARLGSELKTVVATASVPLEGRGAVLRTSETNLGDLVADSVRATARTDIAVVNSGGIRGDRVREPGPITRYDIVEIHPFGNVITTIVLPGQVLMAALEHSVSGLPDAAGGFLQVSGLTMRVDSRAPSGKRVSDVRIGGQPLDPDKAYRVALPDYLLQGGDGYGMFAGQRVVVGPEDGPLMATALETYMSELKTLAPRTDGRITIVR
jgi:5'-nucleotidase / UDP-sugar diphosphatase